MVLMNRVAEYLGRIAGIEVLEESGGGDQWWFDVKSGGKHFVIEVRGTEIGISELDPESELHGLSGHDKAFDQWDSARAHLDGLLRPGQPVE